VIDCLAKNRNKYRLKIELIKQNIVHSLFSKNYDIDRTAFSLRSYAKEIKKRLPSDTDVIFAHSSLSIAFVKSDKLKVFYSDATFAGMLGYYQNFGNYCKQTVRSGNMIEKAALNNCDLIFYTSDWARNSAINDYKISAEKIKVVPRGANIQNPLNIEQITEIINGKSEKICNLLFVGVDWERKGGNIALETTKILHSKGVNVHLDIVGIRQDLGALPHYVTNHGYISKSAQEGQNRINALFENAHFFILPTRSEALGIVFCEASSFGLPSLATDTGGVSTAVHDGKNGKIFAISDSAEKYAEYIQNVFSDFESYKRLCFSSFEEFRNRLNWSVAGKTIIENLEKLLDNANHGLKRLEK
jgi:glycosyltransferase involved in cell wall biosynthesis